MTRTELNAIISQYKHPGFDFNYTLDSGRFDVPEGSVVITGVFIRDREYVESEIEKMGLTSKIKQIEYMTEKAEDAQEIGKFKAEKIIELGLDAYFEDDPKVVYWINEYLDRWEKGEKF